MADRAIREFDGKKILVNFLPEFSDGKIKLNNHFVQINQDSDLSEIEKTNPWLNQVSLVVKPDQLIKRRGQNKLLALNCTWSEAKKWAAERMNKTIEVDGIRGVLNNFIVEPFVPHNEEYEYYLAIRSLRHGDEILFFRQGGVDVGNVEEKAERLTVPTHDTIDEDIITKTLLVDIGEERKERLAIFITAMLSLYRKAGFSYLEINPIALSEDGILVPLDLAAKIDDTAHFECANYWGEMMFPPAFGAVSSPEERYITQLDAKTGASLKLVMLNPTGRVWLLVAGGGASVVYADTIADLGLGHELANYGEYSGAPSDEETYEYAKTLLSLMTREPDSRGEGKVLIIGGGIANFTDVAKTFNGIIRALREYKEPLKSIGARIYVRRGGPNYREGLSAMAKLGDEIGVPIEVHGPESHMTRIVPMALNSLGKGISLENGATYNDDERDATGLRAVL